MKCGLERRVGERWQCHGHTLCYKVENATLQNHALLHTVPLACSIQYVGRSQTKIRACVVMVLTLKSVSHHLDFLYSRGLCCVPRERKKEEGLRSFGLREATPGSLSPLFIKSQSRFRLVAKKCREDYAIELDIYLLMQRRHHDAQFSSQLARKLPFHINI